MRDFYKLISEIKANKEKAEMLDTLGEYSTEIIPADKTGYNFKVYKVNGIEVRREYIEDPDAKGTADSPIEFVDGLSVTPNTYYTHEGVRYVYMGEAKTAETWDDVAEYMAEI